MIVAGRAAPVDPRRRLAGDEAAVLPEILARAGAAAAVQPLDDGRRDPARLPDQARYWGGQRMRLADRVPRRVAFPVACGRAFRHPLLPDARLEAVDYPLDALAVGARREGQRHAVLEHGSRKLEHVIDRRRKAP